MIVGGIPPSKLLDVPARILVALVVFAFSGAVAAGVDAVVHVALRAVGGR